MSGSAQCECGPRLAGTLCHTARVSVHAKPKLPPANPYFPMPNVKAHCTSPCPAATNQSWHVLTFRCPTQTLDAKDMCQLLGSAPSLTALSLDCCCIDFSALASLGLASQLRSLTITEAQWPERWWKWVGGQP